MSSIKIKNTDFQLLLDEIAKHVDENELQRLKEKKDLNLLIKKLSGLKDEGEFNILQQLQMEFHKKNETLDVDSDFLSPPSLFTKSNIRQEKTNITGLYFFFALSHPSLPYDDEHYLIYLGRSNRLKRRLGQHLRSNKFSNYTGIIYTYIQSNPSEIGILEELFLKKFNTPLNIVYNKRGDFEVISFRDFKGRLKELNLSRGELFDL